MGILQKVEDKFTSGRFLSTLMLVATYCTIPFCLVYLVTKGKLSVDFLTGFLAGFGQTVLLVLNFYFEKDKKGKNNGNTNKEN